jgi:FkbM family methyltransferase
MLVAASTNTPAGAVAQAVRRGRDRTGQVEVITVDVRDDVAGRPVEPLVDRMRLSVVRLADPACDPIVVTAQDVDRAVVRAAVDDEILEVGISLLEHRANRALQILGLVQGGRDHRHSRLLHGGHVTSPIIRSVPLPSLATSLRRGVHASLRRVGLDLVRYDPERAPEERRAGLIRDRRIEVVLDVGANNGPFAKQLRRAGYAGRIVSFEPQAGTFAELIAASRADPLWECHQIALGASDTEAVLHVAGNTSSSSLLEMAPAHVAAAPESRYLASEVVAVKRLDTLQNQLFVDDVRAYLKIDVQGFELEVLRGGQEVLCRVDLVECELSLVPLYEGAPLAHELIRHLEDRGFHLLALDTVFVDPKTGRLLQVDGLFARPSG